jgi:hypothetical protein
MSITTTSGLRHVAISFSAAMLVPQIFSVGYHHWAVDNLVGLEYSLEILNEWVPQAGI